MKQTTKKSVLLLLHEAKKYIAVACAEAEDDKGSGHTPQLLSSLHALVETTESKVQSINTGGQLDQA